MTQIKFGTDGWRAIIAQEFTVENVARVAEATGNWLLKNEKSPSVVLGHDCRFAGELFCDVIAKILCSKGIKVLLAKGFVSTPMISYGAVTLKADLGIIITASHNPPEYNGFKLKGSFGGPLQPSLVAEIEAIIPDKCTIDYEKITLDEYSKNGLLEIVDLETMYCDQVEKSFDLNAIKNSGLTLAYDAMYGAGQNVIRKLLPDAALLHCDYNPGFNGVAPEPILKNLLEFSELIKKNDKILCGLATDGDADRIGFFDSKGRFVDSHHLILLLMQYLTKYKGLSGKIVKSFSVS